MHCPDAAVFILSACLVWGGDGVPIFSANSVPFLQQEQAKPGAPVTPVAGRSQDEAAAAPKIVLKDGTPVQLKFRHQVVSSQVIAGEKLELQVVEEVRIGDVVVVAKDGDAEAMVSMAQAKRAMGRGGNMEMKIETVRLTSGETAPLRMIKDVKGGGNKAAMVTGMVATALVLWPAAPFFLFVRGKNAVIPEGTEITAYVNGDVSLDPAKFPPAAAGRQTGREEPVQQERKEPK